MQANESNPKHNLNPNPKKPVFVSKQNEKQIHKELEIRYLFI